jgi:hypothetical protein
MSARGTGEDTGGLAAARARLAGHLRASGPPGGMNGGGRAPAACDSPLIRPEPGPRPPRAA